MIRPARSGAVALLAALSLVSCSPAVTPAPAPAPATTVESAASRSQRALDDLVGDPRTPGCTAAVGERGAVLWHGVSGLADVESGTALTPESLVDMGSVAKQFTATALLLLEHEGQLSLDDRLSEHLDDLPSWADEVTLGQLMRHTSGVPEYIMLLAERSISLEIESSRKEAVEALREVAALDFEPGSEYAYSNSNYLLLGLVVERATREPLGDHLQKTLFAPLDLPIRPVVGSGGLHSYRRSAGGDAFEVADWHWEATGAAGLHSTPSTLVRWADSYRTGAPAASWLNSRRLQDAVPEAEGTSSYAAGILREEDNLLWHGGEWAGFHTAFAVSPDRQRSLAMTCVREELDPMEAALPLVELWFRA